MHALNQHIAKDGFRLRGTALSRIDAFSDVVFGFALTLIVVSLEVPKTYAELHELLLGFLPFGICFVFLIMVWWAHFRFFRRYGLHDYATMVINSTLLFFLLFYVYPLKFLFSIFVRQFTNSVGPNVFQNLYQIREMMLVYCIGFTAVYFSIAALYINAWRLRDDLHLNPLERTLTLTYFWDFFGVGCIGLLCAAIAMLLPLQHSPLAGFAFFSIGLYKTAHGFISGRFLRKARALTSEADMLPLTHGH
jgi:uncharacterized membrane protein